MDALLQRRERDKQMILNWIAWPQSVLPVKNLLEREPSGFPVCGLIFAGRENVVVIGTLFMPVTAESERREFQDVDALLDAGWTVD